MRVNEYNKKKFENAEIRQCSLRVLLCYEQNRCAQRTWLPLEAIAQRCCKNPTIKLRGFHRRFLIAILLTKRY